VVPGIERLTDAASNVGACTDAGCTMAMQTHELSTKQ
jgi:hypothetical protein